MCVETRKRGRVMISKGFDWVKINIRTMGDVCEGWYSHLFRDFANGETNLVSRRSRCNFGRNIDRAHSPDLNENNNQKLEKCDLLAVWISEGVADAIRAVGAGIRGAWYETWKKKDDFNDRHSEIKMATVFPFSRKTELSCKFVCDGKRRAILTVGTKPQMLRQRKHG